MSGRRATGVETVDSGGGQRRSVSVQQRPLSLSSRLSPSVHVSCLSLLCPFPHPFPLNLTDDLCFPSSRHDKAAAVVMMATPSCCPSLLSSL